MTTVPAHEIRDGDIIKARHGLAKVNEAFRDIERENGSYKLGNVTLTIEYKDKRQYTFTVPADREIQRVRYA